MHTKRIIPCLDVKDGKVVKGVNFVGLQEVGDPVELAYEYYQQGADELVFLDITATHEARDTISELCEQVAAKIFIPFTVGGGIRTIDDIKRILRSGADKVSLNSAAVRNPDLIKEGAKIFGSQCIVVAIDAKQRATKDGWNVVINGGRIDTGIDVLEWVKKIQELGAGEILLTSMDQDGRKQGFDIPLLSAVNQIADIPVIASGGCGSLEHFYDVFAKNAADAALAASLFHYGELSVGEVKDYLSYRNIPVRKKTMPKDLSALLSKLDFAKQNGLIPTVVQDHNTKEVLMLAYSSKESLQITWEKGLACYFSRSRNELWLKGETSGHYQTIKEIKTDCDHDTLLFSVIQTTAACHTGAYSCFYQLLYQNQNEVKEEA